MFELYEPLLVSARQLWRFIRVRLWLATLVTGIFVSGLSLWQFREVGQSQIQAEQGTTIVEIIQPSDQIVVDVSGAVLHPGMYQLDAGSRIGQAITRAGGFRIGVDDRAVAQRINLAQKLKDEDKVYVPFVSDAEVISTTTEPTTSDTISINTATTAQLESLAGIGQKRATDIIAGRPYQQLQEVVDRGVLSKTVFEQIKQQLTL
ncbi:MAG: hypothetical protein GW946_01940 [Candidatus Pacebacteria bacterium]|nr:hypothetical protein [Candidatus Paceibacterota bacterium]PIR60270.1 MAG: hypothetical protein COU67_02810 [Candidatus Pacebacteria bacterium CG10_big_fil_rev_8_21_14_0_10_44_54]